MKIRDKRLIFNAVQCNKCNDVVASTSGHDFRYCKCGSIAVDGGLNYERRVGDIHNYTNLSEYEDCLRQETDYERECREAGRPVAWIKEEDYVRS